MVSPSIYDQGAPVGLAEAVETQSDPSACSAVGNNWTSCDDASSSNNLYAQAEDGYAERGSITPITAFQDTPQSGSSALTVANAETAPLANGVPYLVIYSGNHGGSDSSAVSELVLEFGTTVIARGVGEGRGTSNHWDSGQTAGFYLVVGDGTSTLRFRFRCVTSFDTCYAGSMAIIALPLDLLTEGEDYWYEVRNGDSWNVTNAPTGSWTDLLTVPFNLPETGDYIVLMSGEGRSNNQDPVEAARMRFLANGSVLGSDYHQEREDDRDSHNFMKAQVVSLPAGSQTFEVECRSRTDPQADFRRARIVVLRAAAFDQVLQTSDTSGAQSTSTSFVDFSGLDTTFTPNLPEWVVVLANAVLGSSTQAATAELRDDTAGASYRVNGGEMENDVGFSSGRDQQPTLLAHAAQLAATSTWKVRYRADPSGTAVIGRNAANTAGIRSDLIVWGLSLPGPGRNDTAWGRFGFDLDRNDEVQKVEVGVEWFRNNAGPVLNVTVSWDGGVSWATNQTATNKSGDDDSVEWLDFTSATTWNASTLRDANLRIRAGTNASGARLDYLTVRITYNDAPEISNLRLEDPAGQSFAGGLLDPAVAYHFLFNVTDGDGWGDIGSDGAVSLQMWYDGNVTPELTFAEQTNGSNYRAELRYEDLADPGNATLDEWSVVEGSATYDASASSLTEIYNGPTLIGYEFNLSVTLGLMVKASTEPTNGTPGGYNDPDSWNVEALAFDGSVGDRQPQAAGGEHMEFGVFALALMGYSVSASPTTIQPGQSTVFRVDFDNTGQGPASRVWVNVTFPAELTYVSDDATAIGGVRTCCESFEFTDVDPGSYVFNVTASANGGVANGTVAVTNFTYEALDAKDRPINQSAEDVSVTIVNAIMSYSASATPTTLQPGDTTVFRVDFTNAGQGDAGTVWVNVTLPAELTYLSDDAASIGGTVTCCYRYEFTNVAPGTYSLNITAWVNGGVANGTVATTNFTFEAVDPAGTPLISSAQDVDVTLVNGIMSYSVAPADATLAPGETTAFQVTFTNSGGGDAGLVYVNMTLAPQLTYVSDDAASLGGITLCCYSFQFANVSPGSYTFNITVRVNGGLPNGTVAVTNFTFQALDPMGSPLQESAEDESITIYNADMSLAVVADPLSVGPGATTTFRVTFTNTGLANASMVWVNVTLPPELGYVSDDAALIGGVLSGTYSFEFTDVTPGDHTFNLNVFALGGIPNGTVVLTSFALDALDLTAAPLPSFNVDIPVTLLNAYLTYAVTASPTGLEPGQTTSFTIWFNNTGLWDAEWVWINVTLPAGLSYVSDTAASIGGVVSGTYSFEFSAVSPGTHSFLLIAMVDGGLGDGTSLVTNFTFEAVDSQWESFPPASQDVTVMVYNAILDLVVSVAPSVVWPGAQATFLVTFDNMGQGRAASVWINVTLTPELTYVGDDATSIGGVLSGSYNYEFVDVAPGSYMFNLTVAAVGGVANGTMVFTRFTMEGVDPAGAPLSGETHDVAVTLANAILDLTLAASGSLGEPGDALTFTATLTNSGAAPAESLTIEGSVDPNATYGFSSPAGAYDAPARVVRWGLPLLAPGAQATFQWTVTVNPDTPDRATVLAQANVESQDPSGTPLPSQEDSVQVDVNFASFDPVLVTTPLSAERGDEVLASLYYNNTGAGAAGTVWLNWTLNGHFELVALTPEPLFTPTPSGFDVVLSAVPSGPQRVDARLRVLRGLQDALAMGLEISFTSTYRNGNPLDAADLSSAVSLRAPAVDLTLATSTDRLDAGSPLTLNVTIRNTGQAAAQGWLNLTLPAGVAYGGDDGTFAVTETSNGVSWTIPSVPAGAVINLVVTLTAESELGLQAFRFSLEYTEGRGSPPASAISNAVSVQIDPGATPISFPWMWLLLAALVAGVVLFLLTRRLRRPSIEEVFVVHRNGMLLAHHARTFDPERDRDILMAVFQTMGEIPRDALSKAQDAPVRLQLGQFNILLKQGTHHYAAVVFRGEATRSLVARLSRLSQRVEEEYGEMLAGWEGDAGDVRPVKALLSLLWGKRVAREKGAEEETVAAGGEPSEMSLVRYGEETEAPAITRSAVRTARKAQLQEWCLLVGLDDSGNVADLRKRLLDEVETREEESVPEAELESAPTEDAVGEDFEAGLDESPEAPPQDGVEGAEEEDIVKSIEAEIEAIEEAYEAGSEEAPTEVPEVTPKEGDIEEVVTPFVVLGKAEEAMEKGKERKKAKKDRRAKKDRKAKKTRKGKAKSKQEEPPVKERHLEEELEDILAEESGEAGGGPNEEPATEIPEEAVDSAPELTVKQIWDAPKTQLREWCQQYGLDDTGPIMSLRLRLLSRIEPS